MAVPRRRSPSSNRPPPKRPGGLATAGSANSPESTPTMDGLGSASGRPILERENAEYGEIVLVGRSQPFNPPRIIQSREKSVQNPLPSEPVATHPIDKTTGDAVVRETMGRLNRTPPEIRPFQRFLEVKWMLESTRIGGNVKKLLQNLRRQRQAFSANRDQIRNTGPYRFVARRFRDLVGDKDRRVQTDHERSKNPSRSSARPAHGSMTRPTETGGGASAKEGNPSLLRFSLNAWMVSLNCADAVRPARRA